MVLIEHLARGQHLIVITLVIYAQVEWALGVMPTLSSRAPNLN